jgi:hypothetical protein
MSASPPESDQGIIPAGGQRKQWDAFSSDTPRLTSWWIRADRWPILLLALALLLAYFWVYRTPKVAMVALNYVFDFGLAFFLFAMLAAGRGFQLHLRSCSLAKVGVRADVVQAPRRVLPWLLAITVATYLMLWYRLPMYVSFVLSRPGFEQIAEAALADPANAHLLADRWAGLYYIAGVEVIGSTVVLYVGEDQGTYGFAKVPGAMGDRVWNIPGHEGSPDYHRDFPPIDGWKDRMGQRLAGDWFVIYSGYWSVKIGWS